MGWGGGEMQLGECWGVMWLESRLGGWKLKLKAFLASLPRL